MYHVTARGNRRGSIFRCDSDRLVWLSLLDKACARFNLRVLAYCQMTNHYHLVLETPEGKLSTAMQYLNACYSQYFNRRYQLSGHVFQGRFTAIVCDRTAYLLELMRYVVLNPVRAHMVRHPDDWAWSSHRCMLGMSSAPAWLPADYLLSLFGPTPEEARHAYLSYVLGGIGKASPLRKVKHQVLLGDQGFIDTVTAARALLRTRDYTQAQRRATAAPLADYFSSFEDRQQAMAQAYRSRAYSMQQIASFCGVSAKTVSRAIRQYESRMGLLDRRDD